MGLFKQSFKQEMIDKAMREYDYSREHAVKLIKSLELQQEIILSKRIENVSKSINKDSEIGSGTQQAPLKENGEK